eukprot:CAMPEP_0176446154 /NCGR_PEP_ID=MMETSP0127-20121128/24144_1 /TAXON_ID=938130 /ORGANISM="Platyophrya macrostoma, Strain WH" /LENGTH=266 /DNA_ID=CAMNT_0017832109 /DNA_START=29 /DNA_END=829 /DNA_ORIENTATION=-
MINEETLRKLQAVYSFERMRNPTLSAQNAQNLNLNLSAGLPFNSQSLSSSVLWAQPSLGVGVSNSLQAQLLLRAQLASGGFGSLAGPMPHPILNMMLLNNLQNFSPQSNSLQVQPDLQSVIDKIQQLSKPLEKVGTLLEKPIAVVPQISKIPTDTSGNSLTDNTPELSKTVDTNTDELPEGEVNELEATESDRDVDKVSLGKKIKKKKMVCGHSDRKHYAKGYCSECYHKKCRMQKPKLCGHDNLYARELCQRCYAEKYKKKGKRN